MVLAGTTAVGNDELWGIGWYPSPGGLQPYEATAAELERHEEIALTSLRDAGVTRDDIVLFAGRSSEAVQFAPWERASNRLGAAFTVVDGYRVDTQRLLAYLDQFSLNAVLGLPDALAAGVAEQVDLAAILGRVPVLAARPHARARLAAAGVEARLWLHGGPAVAVECGARAGAHIDPRWRPAAEDGELVVHASEDQRLAPRVATGLRASILSDRCSCGNSSPRVVLDRLPAWDD
jgi:hypothetical protein